jgi:hypothetical protein
VRHEGKRVRALKCATRSATSCSWLRRRRESGASRLRRPPGGGKRPAAAAEADTWRSGASNRGPPKAKEGHLTSSVRVLTSGIDSLYLSVQGEVRPEVAESLERLKATARECGYGQPVEQGGVGKAVVQPSGWGRYRYWLRCDGFDVFVGLGDHLPAAYVQVKSSLLHEVGARNALVEVGLFLNGPVLNGVGEARCSRVDIYTDFQGWVPRSADYERFVVRSRKNTWHTSVHHDGRKFSEFSSWRAASWLHG